MYDGEGREIHQRVWLLRGGSRRSIESFNDPSMTWSLLNDPVMGGESTSAVGVRDGIGTETIETVVNDAFLHFPRFSRTRPPQS